MLSAASVNAVAGNGLLPDDPGGIKRHFTYEFDKLKLFSEVLSLVETNYVDDVDAVQEATDDLGVLYRGWLAELGPSPAVLSDPRKGTQSCADPFDDAEVVEHQNAGSGPIPGRGPEPAREPLRRIAFQRH